MNAAAKRILGYAVAAVAVLWAVGGVSEQSFRLDRTAQAARGILQEFFPPDFSQFGMILDALVETIQIAILATLIGYVLSLPLGLLSARTLTPSWAHGAARFIASAIRVLPAILWALLAVILLGPGPIAGVVAMSLYTIGYLAKLQSEAYEGLPRDSLDAVRAMGANRFQVAWHVVLPEAGNTLRSQLLFMLEYNIRSSSVIGIVGAGGLGFLLSTYLQFFQYGRVSAVILVLLATVLVVDALGYRIRKRFVEE